MKVSRGARNHVVRIEAAGSPIPDGDGGFVDVWTPIDPPTWYCAIEPVTAANQERLVAGTVETLATHRLHGDYHPQLSSVCRMFLDDPERGTRRFDVLSVQADDARRFSMTAVAAEYVTDHDPRPQRGAPVP
jgi:hypothetical protein